MEITEDVIMADPERSLEVVGRLSTAGVQVALDDFGTGYSSLAYLKHLPVDELKIDRTFVASMTTDPADAAIVQTAIDLGRRLGIAVVAEGVEDAASLESLATMGASRAQGFHIARPMPADELLPRLESSAVRLPGVLRPSRPAAARAGPAAAVEPATPAALPGIPRDTASLRWDGGGMNPATSFRTHHPAERLAGPAMVELEDLVRVFGRGEGAVRALDGVSLSFARGSFTAVMGPSGSGKSTLLQAAAGLDRPTSGRVRLGDHELGELSEKALAGLRRERIGFVFQSFNLLGALTAEQNVALPARLAGRRLPRSVVRDALERVGLGDRAATVPPSSRAASSSASRSRAPSSASRT